MTDIGIYARKSVYRDTSESVATQIKLCKEYARIIYRGQDINFIVYGKDEGFSGFNMNRPSFKQMMKDVENGLLDVVMVYRLDRISRNVPEFSQIFDTLQKHQVSFTSVKESFDTSTPIGRTVMYILAAFAQLERDTTSERVSDSMNELARMGFWTGGRCPAGTSSVKKVVGGKEHSFLVLNENIDYIKKLYQLFLSGYSITALERYCKNQGIKSLTGKYLNTSQLHFILTNPVYCQNSPEALTYFADNGYALPDRPELLFDGEHGLIAYGRNPQSQSSSGAVKPITISVGIHDWAVSSSDWIAVQKRMGVNKQVRTSKYECGILKGVLRCKCGCRMITKIYNQKGSQYRNYLCSVRDRKGKEYCDSGHIRMDDVDDMFLEKLKEIRLDKSKIQLRDYTPAPQVLDESRMRREMEAIEIKIENLTRTLQENADSSAAKYIVRQIDRLDGELASLQAMLQRSKFQAIEAANAQNARDHVYSQVCFLLDHFDSLSYREKNELIKKTVKECTFDNDTLHIVF